jgi:hypothetical protein
VVRELQVSGEIRTIAAREGSSGILSGDIEGLYQGYRFASTTPDEREYLLEAPNGTLALMLRQQIVTPLPPRPDRHPFAGGRDPLPELPASSAAPPASGPTAGGGGAGPGIEGGREIFKRVHYMEVTAHVLPDRSTGIFEGATGDIEIVTPAYRMAGYMVVDTSRGKLKLEFLEKGSRDKLDADLWVDGEESTGMWSGARGELKFSLEITPPFYGLGPYWGTIYVEEEPSA